MTVGRPRYSHRVQLFSGRSLSISAEPTTDPGGAHV
jgi:hypothetical protein